MGINNHYCLSLHFILRLLDERRVMNVIMIYNGGNEGMIFRLFPTV